MKRQYRFFALLSSLLLLVVGVLWSVFDWSTDSSDARRRSAPANELAETALGDESPDSLPERVAAVRNLQQHGASATPELRRVFQQSTESQVRAMAIQGLGENRDWQSIDVLVEALESPDPLVRGRAGAAVQKIMKVDFNFRANDSAERRSIAIADIRRLLRVAKANGDAYYTAQSLDQ